MTQIEEDILIKIGYLLKKGNILNHAFRGNKIRLSRYEDADKDGPDALYSVEFNSELVFSVAVDGIKVETIEYIPGPWEIALNNLYKIDVSSYKLLKAKNETEKHKERV